MKKMMLLGLLGLSLFGKDLVWESYKEGMLKKEDKPKLYMLSATYCDYCKKNKEMMNDEENLNFYINKNFTTISQERDIENVPKYLDSQLTPVYYVLNDKGEILGEPLKGAQNKDTLLKYLNMSYYKYKYQGQ